MFRGVSGLVSAVKGVDINGFIEGLKDIQTGLHVAGASEMLKQVATAVEGAISVADSGQDFVETLKEGLSFSRKRDWYPALRLSDTLLQGGQFATFKELVCNVPCRKDVAFLWGVCQRLAEVATDPTWDAGTHQSAIEFFGVIYRNDATLGQQVSIKQWIITILMGLSSSSELSVRCK